MGVKCYQFGDLERLKYWTLLRITCRQSSLCDWLSEDSYYCIAHVMMSVSADLFSLKFLFTWRGLPKWWWRPKFVGGGGRKITPIPASYTYRYGVGLKLAKLWLLATSLFMTEINILIWNGRRFYRPWNDQLCIQSRRVINRSIKRRMAECVILVYWDNSMEILTL